MIDAILQHSRIMQLSTALLLLAATSVNADECLSYSKQLTLQGILSRHTFPEQPNYESIANGDAKASYFFLTPNKSFCVADSGSNEGMIEPAEAAVNRVQLVFPDGKVSYRRLQPFLGKEVFCSGSFFHAITGHHHSPVLLDDAKCRPNSH